MTGIIIRRHCPACRKDDRPFLNSDHEDDCCLLCETEGSVVDATNIEEVVGAAVTMKATNAQHDAVTFLGRAYDDYVRHCRKIAELGFPDDDAMRDMDIYASEIDYWRGRVSKVIRQVGDKVQ